MPGLDKTMGAMPSGGTHRVYGKAHWDGSHWFANVGGNLLDCRWLSSVRAFPGLNVVVDITDDGRGQSTALVVGSYEDQPKPATGTAKTILPAGTHTRLVFTGSDGIDYTTERYIGSYSSGDPVYVTWDGDIPTVMGVIRVPTPWTPQQPPQQPTPVRSGVVTVSASVSDTFGATGGWGAGPGDEDVYTGSMGGASFTGAWFYGPPRPVLQGRTITRVRFRLPKRLSVGEPDPATIHLYAHTSQARPNGDVTRTLGPHDVVIPHGSGPTWHDLPLTFAAVLQAGGGISIAGAPYAAFNSRLKDPESGKLQIDWVA